MPPWFSVPLVEPLVEPEVLGLVWSVVEPWFSVPLADPEAEPLLVLGVV